MHQLATVLTIALAGKLAGVRGVTALSEFAERLTQAQLAAVRARLRQKKRRRIPPSRTSFHRILTELDPDHLDKALRAWATAQSDASSAVALDGKACAERIEGPKTSRETVCGITSLPPERAGEEDILMLNRKHWEIENRLHYVRDFTCDEDRCRVKS